MNELFTEQGFLTALKDHCIPCVIRHIFGSFMALCAVE